MAIQDSHVFQGLKRDNHQIKQDSKFLWDAHNIRFTARDDNTLLSMTNEKGTSTMPIVFSGKYLGHCIVNNTLVVFTIKDNITYIVKSTQGESGVFSSCTRLYEGNLNMDENHPIQTLCSYESDLVQKVYWIDGKNQPRVINIVADKLKNYSPVYDEQGNENLKVKQDTIYPEGCFDFVQDLQLKETVEVTRIEGGGSFSPGTIQYAFSYFNKYGQESNIFYTTELLYVSFHNRGGSPEDNIANTFHIKIQNVETKFDYLRIYSIHRTSIDATPATKLVTDIEIGSNKKINFFDTGLIGSDIDPTKLLYIGGESITANTMVDKDNTLFLGNIEVIRKSIPSEVKTAVTTLCPIMTTRDVNFDTTDYNTDSRFYSYKSQLIRGNPSTFKVGDYYRLGLQCQYKNGKWSEPIWIKDFQVIGKDDNGNSYRPELQTTQVVVPAINVDLSTIKEKLIDLGYKKVRPLVVLPTIYDRMVLAQGIICPTVFSVKYRENNSPSVQSSWFFRPMSAEDIDNDSNVEQGAEISFKHLDALKSGGNRGAEIQNMTDLKISEIYKSTVTNTDRKNINTFYVDQSIVTMHSPDIEFDDSTKLALKNADVDFSIVGLTGFSSSAGDISIQTSSAPPAPGNIGFIHNTTFSTGYSNRILASGLFYGSHLIDDQEGPTYEIAGGTDEANNLKGEYGWMVYPWHRTGSLNNDTNRGEGKGTRTAVLKRKVISNIRVAENNVWIDPWTPKYGITTTNIFDSNEVSLVKIPAPTNSSINIINYYGNVDTLITNTSNNISIWNPDDNHYSIFQAAAYPHLFSDKVNSLDTLISSIGDFDKSIIYISDPVRMKYKSTAHAVFAFNYMGVNSPVILPYISGGGKEINKCSYLGYSPFYNGTASITTYEEVKEIKGIGSRGDITDEGLLRKVNSTLTLIQSYGNYAISTCWYDCPNATDYGSLYYTALTTISSLDWEWKLYTNLGNYSGKIFKGYNESGTTEYYEVIYYNNNFILHRISTTATTINTQQDEISFNTYIGSSLLYLGELKRKTVPSNIFGGKTDEAFRNNSWIPAGEPIDLNENDIIQFKYGDTYYQRYDCLKTYPFTTEDENSIIDIASFMCETRVNIDGRYDRNRGNLSNLNVSPTNFNLLNNVYSQKDNFFNYRMLEDYYYRNVKYPCQVLWSTEKSNLEDVDAWTNVTLASSLDLNGSSGKLVSLEVFNDTLLAFQEKSTSQILFNSRVQIPTSDSVPIEISNNYKVEGTRIISDTVGCQNKYSIAKSPLGLYFIDDNSNTLYQFNGQLQNISDSLGGRWWLKNNTNVRLSYDPNNKDLYLSPSNEEVLCYSESLGCFTSLMSYNDAIMFPVGNNFYSLKYKSDKEEISFYRNFTGPYNYIFSEIKLPSFTYISNDNAAYTKIFDTIEYRADMYDNDGNLLHNKSFDWIQSYNEYQDSGIKALNQSRRIDDKSKEIFRSPSLRKKFRVWRGIIPRQGRERMRNPWTAISLGFNKVSNKTDNYFHFVLHDISTKYTI